MTRRVLVLCTGNSCRSVLAEALINQLGKGTFEAVSAGSKPAGYVHPKSIETLKRHGIDPGTPSSKSWDIFAGQKFDVVVTVCDEAAAVFRAESQYDVFLKGAKEAVEVRKSVGADR